MSAQNLVSATLADETKNDILARIAEIRSRMDFLVRLSPDQVRSLFKASNGYAPFIEKAHAVARTHPEILTSMFPAEEFDRDYNLIQSLAPIQTQLAELLDAVQDTLLAANSDAMTEALEVYTSMKLHKEKVPGLAATCDEMGVFFQRTRSRAPAAALSKN